jgi:tRNA(Ile)-lysidine synthase
MPRQRRLGDAQLLRPLLAFSRAQLESWARLRGLDWVEDPTNARMDYDRNFVRHQVLQPLRERWPGVTSRLVLSADLLGETTELVEALARIDLQGCTGPQASLSGAALAGLTPARRRNLLRFWVSDQAGVSLNAPLLARIEQDVLQAAADRQPSLRLGRFWLRRYRADLFLVPLRRHGTEHTLAAIALAPGLFELPGGRLSVVARIAAVGSPDCLRTLEAVRLRYRRDGERCRPVGRKGSHPLKKLFQEAGIAPWLRDEWPVLVCGDEIVAVAGLWVCEGWQAKAGEPGYALDWQRA